MSSNHGGNRKETVESSTHSNDGNSEELEIPQRFVFLRICLVRNLVVIWRKRLRAKHISNDFHKIEWFLIQIWRIHRYASFCFTSTVNYFKVVSILRKKPSNLCSFQRSYLLVFFERHLNVESHRIILTLILSFFILHSITQKSHKNVPFRKLPRKIATENCSNWKSQKNLRVLSESFWRKQ